MMKKLIMVLIAILILAEAGFIGYMFYITSKELATDRATEVADKCEFVTPEAEKRVCVTSADKGEVWVLVEYGGYGSKTGEHKNGVFKGYTTCIHVRLKGKFIRDRYGNWRIVKLSGSNVYCEDGLLYTEVAK